MSNNEKNNYPNLPQNSKKPTIPAKSTRGLKSKDEVTIKKFIEGKPDDFANKKKHYIQIEFSNEEWAEIQKAFSEINLTKKVVIRQIIIKSLRIIAESSNPMKEALRRMT